MPTYKAPVEDSLFLLNDVFHVERYNNLPGFAEATPEQLTKAKAAIAEALAPHAAADGVRLAAACWLVSAAQH